jgi:hypothetical protein
VWQLTSFLTVPSQVLTNNPPSPLLPPNRGSYTLSPSSSQTSTLNILSTMVTIISSYLSFTSVPSSRLVHIFPSYTVRLDMHTKLCLQDICVLKDIVQLGAVSWFLLNVVINRQMNLQTWATLYSYFKLFSEHYFVTISFTSMDG